MKNLLSMISAADLEQSMKAKKIAELMQENKYEELSKNFIPPVKFRYIKNTYHYIGAKYPHIYQYELLDNHGKRVCYASFTKFEILEALGLLPDTVGNPNRN